MLRSTAVTRPSQFRPARQPSSDRLTAPQEQTFRCVGCGLTVSCAPLAAGVLNRNHCPVCLFSRHLDWREAGDRRSNCRAAMEPVGLVTKPSRNKYARERDGELQIVHRCVACGRLSLNRVAADDDPEAILALLDHPDPPRDDGLAPLTPADRALVRRRLFGAGR
jgi:hypothetical protein